MLVCSDEVGKTTNVLTLDKRAPAHASIKRSFRKTVAFRATWPIKQHIVGKKDVTRTTKSVQRPFISASAFKSDGEHRRFLS